MQSRNHSALEPIRAKELVRNQGGRVMIALSRTYLMTLLVLFLKKRFEALASLQKYRRPCGRSEKGVEIPMAINQLTHKSNEVFSELRVELRA